MTNGVEELVIAGLDRGGITPAQARQALAQAVQARMVACEAAIQAVLREYRCTLAARVTISSAGAETYVDVVALPEE
jgi:hypothetical protein